MMSFSRSPFPAAFADDEARWSALLARGAADGAFVYGVTTTGIACRSTCASRRPLRANTRFFASFEEAQAGGFRACRRCRPDTGDHPQAAQRGLVDRLCRLIDSAEVPPSLAELAREAGMSPYHLHRVFRAAVGVTPKGYAAARRRERLHTALPAAASVTAAAYDAGYASGSRFYANAAAELGMTPIAFRAGGAGVDVRFTTGVCSLGAILVAVTERGVCAIDLGDDAQTLQAKLVARFPRARIAAADAALERQLAAAIALVDGESERRAELALDIAGTAFAQRVWAALRAIPRGETATYGEIAATIGAPGSARAVAKACASNPLAVAIPCHRAVRKDGTPTAYRWGATRKQALLRRERGVDP
jgi:AraC family transcriptional regulator of adaptative response/methylated-DNA-[protein]-cysteine methyltransferase